jgi:prepilin-type N-terminal cleavage/methylation domain-containing protein
MSALAMTSSRRRRFRSMLRRGYTAVEVLMAMTVLAIGAASVMSMQRASMQGNLDARKTDVANSIARMWVERIQRDAMQWTTPGPSSPATAAPGNLGTAKVLNAASAAAGNWILPDQYIGLNPPLSPGYDILGRDLVNADLPTALFCVNVRLTWLDQSSTPQLARVDVRVLWPRGISNSAPAGGFCNATTAALVEPELNATTQLLQYHSVYTTTAVRGNPQ